MTNGAYREWEIMWANENPHAHHTDGPIDEDAYRRGFQQGSEAALEAIKAGMPRRRLERWRMAIYRWRFMRSHKKRTPPPRINGGQR
jgi:hypothetical protein